MDTSFRQARHNDIEMIVLLARQLYEQDHIPYDPVAIRAALAALIGDPSLGRAWLIVADGQVAGYLVLTFGYSIEYGGRDAFVDELVLDAAFRGRGLGTAALEFVVAACLQLGVRALHLEVDFENEGARRLYSRLGFVEHERFLMTRRIGE